MCHVDAMVSVGNNFFYTKSLPCSLWFFDKGKTDTIKDKVLFIDARNYYTVVESTLNEWTDWELKNMNAIVWLYRGEIDKYSALLNEYRSALGSDKPFADQIHELGDKAKTLRSEEKKAVKAAEKRKKKRLKEMKLQYEKLPKATTWDEMAKILGYSKEKFARDLLYGKGESDAYDLELVKIIDDMANQKPQNPSQKNPNRKNKKTGTTNTANTANTGTKVNNAGENVQTGVGSLSAILGLLGASSLGLFKSKRK